MASRDLKLKDSLQKTAALLRKAVKYILYAVAGVTIFCLAVYFFLAKALGLDTRIADDVQKNFGLECKIGEVHLLVLPKPGLLLKNVELTPREGWLAQQPDLLPPFQNSTLAFDNKQASASSETAGALQNPLEHNATSQPGSQPGSQPTNQPGSQPDSLALQAKPVSPPVELLAQSLIVYFDLGALFSGEIKASGLALRGAQLKLTSLEQIKEFLPKFTGSSGSDVKKGTVLAQGNIKVSEVYDPAALASLVDLLSAVSISDSSILLREAEGQYRPFFEHISFGEFLGRIKGSVTLNLLASGQPYALSVTAACSRLKVEDNFVRFHFKLELSDADGFDAELVTDVDYDNEAQKIALGDVRLEGYESRARGDLEVKLAPSGEEPWSAQGRLGILNLNLPYWIDSLRNLSPELGQLLSAIKGKTDVRLSSKGLFFENIDARLERYSATGQGSIAFSEAKPVVRFDFNIPEFVWELVFPELAKERTAARDLVWPALPRFLESDPNSDSTDLEILFKADKTFLRDLAIGSVTARLVNQPVSTKWLLSAASVAGGRIESSIELGDNDDNLAATGQINNVDIRAALEGLALNTDIGGNLSSSFQLAGNVASMQVFFQTLQAKAEGKGINISFGRAAKESKKNAFNFFDELSFSANVNGVKPQAAALAALSQNSTAAKTLEAGSRNQSAIDSALPEQAGQAGQGKSIFDVACTLADKQGQDTAKGSFKGQIVFDAEHNVQIDKMNFDGEVVSVFPAVGFKNPEKATLKGNFDYSQKLDQLALRLNSLNLASLGGGVEVLFKNLTSNDAVSYSGKFALKTDMTRVFLDKIGMKTADFAPASLHKGALSGSFALSPQKDGSSEFRATSLKGNLDYTEFSGELLAKEGKTKSLKLTLQAGPLNLDNYFAQENANKHKIPATPWKVKQMLADRLDASVKFENLTYEKIPLRGAEFVVKVENGQLDAKLGGDLCRGALLASLNGEEQNGLLRSVFKVEASQLDLEDLTKTKTGEIKAGGKVNFFADLQGSSGSFDDVPKAYSGNWGFKIGSGYINRTGNVGPASRKSSRQETGARAKGEVAPSVIKTTFDYASGDGPVQNGVLKSDNIVLSGPTTSAKGDGSIDLVDSKIDLFLDIKLAGVSFPIALKGKLADPDVSFKSGHFVTKNLFNIGGGVLGIIGGVITLPVKLIEGAGASGDKAEPSVNATSPGP